MGNALLATKLEIPQVRQDAVERLRLFRCLDEGLSRRLTLVSASAGYGKTTVVAAWAHQVQHALAWVSLDEGDNDPGRFLDYVSAALARVVPDAGTDSPPIIKPGQSTALAEAVVTPLVNAIMRAGDDVVLVLDDYHLVENRVIHHVMTYLLDHMPPNMHVMLMTRADPPFPLARLRGRNDLVELRGADLAFTQDEVGQFLNRRLQLGLSSGQVAELRRRTEGWVTGLQLAGLSLQNAGDSRQFITTFTGSHEYIADYLLDEVLSRQDEHTRSFLLSSSILDRLHESLCSAVTGQDDCQQTLDYLYSANLFLQPLDNHRRWFAYHRLFSDLLRQRLSISASRDTVKDLHRRAAAWFVENGFPDEAVQHFIAAGDVVRAADTVEGAAEDLLMRSQSGTLLRWVEQLPPGIVHARPVLNVCMAWALLLNNYSLESLKPYLVEIEMEAPARTRVLRAYVAMMRGYLAEAHSLAESGKADLPPENRFHHEMAEWIITMSDIINTRLHTSSTAIREAIQGGFDVSNVLVMVQSLCYLAELYMRQARLVESLETYQRALALAQDASGKLLPVAGIALVGMAGLFREWDDLAAAEDCATRGIDLLEGWSSTATIEAYLNLAFIDEARGRLKGASAMLHKARGLAVESDMIDIDDKFVYVLEARFMIRRGDLDSAEKLIRKSGCEMAVSAVLPADLTMLDYHIYHHQRLALARLYYARHHLTEALTIIDQLVDGIARFAYSPSRRELEVHLVKALVLHGMGQLDPALIWLEKALSAAKQGGYIRSISDEGADMAHLLAHALQRGIHTDYVQRLLDTFPQAPPAAPLIEALSERELAVLRLIADGLTNAEIAHALVVATGTIKAHTSSIYSKLGVNNRVQAIAAAREIGLL